MQAMEVLEPPHVQCLPEEVEEDYATQSDARPLHYSSPHWIGTEEAEISARDWVSGRSQNGETLCMLQSVVYITLCVTYC